MEILRKEYEQELTGHLNSIDTTCSIQFTYKKESDEFAGCTNVTELGWNSDIHSVSEEDTLRPVSEL